MSLPRIAVVGAGLIGRRHVALVAAARHCELAAVVDPDPRSRGLAAAHGVPHHESLAALLDDPADDPASGELGVVVATPNHDHVPAALQCVRRGVPVLVEKPVADDLDSAQLLVEESERAGSPVLVGHHRRHSPLLRTARRVVEDGLLGDVVAVQGSATFRKPDDYFGAAPWRREVGGGPVLINMVHEVDDLRMLCGDVVSVQAVASSATRRFPVEDTVALTLRFASGALGSFLLSDIAASARSWELTSGENPAYPRHPDENCYEIAGTRGSLSVPTMTLRTYDGPPSWWEPMRSRVVDVDRTDPLAAQLDHFVGVVRGEEQALITPRDAALTLATTLAVLEAARSGAAVEPRGLLSAAAS